MEITRKAQHQRAKSSLPDDVLVKIFMRLPVKSLLQFSCLSKAWHVMLTDDYYRKKLPQPMSGLFYNRRRWKLGSEYASTQKNSPEPKDAMMSFLPYKNLQVLASCNGLLLCYCWKTNPRPKPNPDSGFYVCNPATKRWDQIPWPRDRYISMTVLAFDANRSPHYNVVSFSHTRCMVLSSETGEWAQFQDFELNTNSYEFQQDAYVFLNGNIHLLDVNRPVVIGVHLERKVCRNMEVPYASKELVVERCLGQFAGCLRWAYETRNQIFIWDLVNYDNNEWNLKCTINLQAMLEKPWNLISRMDLQDIVLKRLGISSYEDHLYAVICIVAFHPDLDIAFICARNKLYAYNLTSANIVELCTLRGVHPSKFWTYSPSYSEDCDL